MAKPKGKRCDVCGERSTPATPVRAVTVGAAGKANAHAGDCEARIIRAAITRWQGSGAANDTGRGDQIPTAS